MNMSVLVLAGGRSRRMGTDKKELRWNGKTFLDSLAETVQQAGLSPLLVSAQRNVPGYKTVLDEHEGRGPLEGILCGLKAIRTQKMMVLAVDTPQLPATLLEAVARHAVPAEAQFTVLSHDSFDEAMISVIDCSLLPSIEKMMENGCLRPLMIRELGTFDRYYYDGDLDRIRSINSPEEYERLGRKFEAL